MKRILFYLTGLIILTFGVTSIIASDIGASAWDSVFVGLTNLVGLSPGIWLIIICSILMFVNAYLLKKKIDFSAGIPVVIQGLLIDFWLLFVFNRFIVSNLGLQGILFIVGFLAVVLGTTMYLQANFAPDPIDNLMIAVHERFRLSLGRARLLCEGIALMLALIFSGPVFIGTLIITLGIGPLIQISHGYMTKFYGRA